MANPAESHPQNDFINAARKERKRVEIYLVNGIRLTGCIESFDQYLVMLRTPVGLQGIYKRAISTIQLDTGGSRPGGRGPRAGGAHGGGGRPGGREGGGHGPYGSHGGSREPRGDGGGYGARESRGDGGYGSANRAATAATVPANRVATAAMARASRVNRASPASLTARRKKAHRRRPARRNATATAR
ncbi:hypothetical protein BMMON2_29650 [Burkholderia mallei]